MHPGQARTSGAALLVARAAHGKTGQEFDNGGGLSGDAAKRGAGSVRYRFGAGEAMIFQPAHQAQKIGQVGLVRPCWLIHRQDEPPGVGFQQIVGIADPLGNTLEGRRHAQVEPFEEAGEVVLGNVCVNGHQADATARALGSLNATVS